MHQPLQAPAEVLLWRLQAAGKSAALCASDPERYDDGDDDDDGGDGDVDGDGDGDVDEDDGENL